MPWTDHNTHDAGITILEVLSYGITAYGVGMLVSERDRPVGAWRGVGLALIGAAGVVIARRVRCARRRRGRGRAIRVET